jgi:hypothetical protein
MYAKVLFYDLERSREQGVWEIGMVVHTRYPGSRSTTVEISTPSIK